MEINRVFPSAVDDIVVKEITAGYFISRSFLILCAYARLGNTPCTGRLDVVSSLSVRSHSSLAAAI